MEQVQGKVKTKLKCNYTSGCSPYHVFFRHKTEKIKTNAGHQLKSKRVNDEDKDEEKYEAWYLYAL